MQHMRASLRSQAVSYTVILIVLNLSHYFLLSRYCSTCRIVFTRNKFDIVCTVLKLQYSQVHLSTRWLSVQSVYLLVVFRTLNYRAFIFSFSMCDKHALCLHADTFCVPALFKIIGNMSDTNVLFAVSVLTLCICVMSSRPVHKAVYCRRARCIDIA